MKITVKPSFIRERKQERTEMRKWAADKTPEVQAHVDVFCYASRNWQHNPLDDLAPLAWANCFMAVAAAHGAYRKWD